MERAPSGADTISALNIVSVVAALTRLGIDGAGLLARAGGSLDAMNAAHARVPAALEHAFWDEIDAHTRDPLIGLRIADQIEVGALGAYEYLLCNSQTLRAALEQANRFERVIDDALRIGLVESEAQVCVRLGREGSLPHHARGRECLFAVALRRVVELLPGARVLELRFVHPAHCEPGAFRAYLGCPVRFGSAHDEIAFATGALDRPLSRADPALSRVLEQHMLQILELLPQGDAFLQRARTLLGTALDQGQASLEQLARALHLSPRTLRRRLAERGTSYTSLLDELRRELARHHVTRTPASFDEIATKLGFADTSAFYRAFKRWTATTPAAYRAGLRARAVGGGSDPPRY